MLKQNTETMSTKSIFLACLATCLISTEIVAQNAPTVVTDTRFARGATMAFGRIKSAVGNGGVSISKRGFCLSENPEPTIDDIISTKQLSNSGAIYYFENLKPATMYYMRAYATNKNGETGYGDVIKFSTIPMGEITYWYNNGGDDAANKRINDAATNACNIFSNLTCIKKHFSIGYSEGTPTADCYYADEPWMNMGKNSSYQRTGTIMHEMQHGLGVIPYSTQWAGSIMREGSGTGHWLGDRVSEFLNFWDNTTGSQLNGDTQHMWPYGINGASEDDGSLKTYYANAMIGQALGEDGLEHRSNTFADPYYSFNQEDDVKYYFKNESTERGLYDSYLIPTSTGLLKWRKMTSAEAQANDSTAWYITFTPENQYYQIRNAATGQYLTYNNGIKTMERSTLTDNDNFHLMRGRVDVGSGKAPKRGYWIIHPTGDWSPKSLQANTNGNTGQANFNLANTATNQRWLILTADEMEETEQGFMAQLKNEVNDLLAKVKPLANVPHYENIEGADEAFAKVIADAEQTIAESTIPGDFTSLYNDVRQSVIEFLGSVTATMKSKPFDLTFFIQSPRMTQTNGWNGNMPVLNYSAGEFYEKTFDFNQTITNLASGSYDFCVQGFQRPGKSADVYKAFQAGTDNITAYIYAGSVSQKLVNICVDAQPKKLGGTEVAVATNLYIPNNMQASSYYFKKGLYENKLPVQLKTKGSLKLGLRCSKSDSNYWTIFDNFRLYYYGRPVKGDLNGDGKVNVADIYVIAQFIAGNNSEYTITDCDVNDDGEVTEADIAAVAAIIAGE